MIHTRIDGELGEKRFSSSTWELDSNTKGRIEIQLYSYSYTLKSQSGHMEALHILLLSMIAFLLDNW